MVKLLLQTKKNDEKNMSEIWYYINVTFGLTALTQVGCTDATTAPKVILSMA